jgi:hypothetical protein
MQIHAGLLAAAWLELGLDDDDRTHRTEHVPLLALPCVMPWQIAAFKRRTGLETFKAAQIRSRGIASPELGFLM